LLCDRQDWATAQDIFAKVLEKLEWDFYQIHEPKFLEIIEQMQEVLNENPHLAQNYPADFFHDVCRISDWGAKLPVFVWLVKGMGTHLLWQTPKLKGRHNALEQIKDFARNYSPEGKLFVGHLKFNTLQEVSPSEAEKFFPVNPQELKAYLEYVPTLEEFVTNLDNISEHLNNVRAIAKELNLEENLENCLQRVVSIAYNNEAKAILCKEGERDFYWDVRVPETNRRVMNGGIIYHSSSNAWSIHT
jgi:hypothetical protein